MKNNLFIFGMLLFLFGLLNGVAIPYFENPRMGLSAHLAGVQNAFVLIIFGLIWKYIALTQVVLRWCCCFSVYGMYSIWFSLVLAAVWGTSSATPIAGAGYSGYQYQENIVNILLYSGSLSIIVASIQIIIGLLKNGKVKI
ncbi:MAG: hypothetical protein ACPG52_02295 [Cognaticolwellia sp.]